MTIWGRPRRASWGWVGGGAKEGREGVGRGTVLVVRAHARQLSTREGHKTSVTDTRSVTGRAGGRDSRQRSDAGGREGGTRGRAGLGRGGTGGEGGGWAQPSRALPPPRNPSLDTTIHNRKPSVPDFQLTSSVFIRVSLLSTDLILWEQASSRTLSTDQTPRVPPRTGEPHRHPYAGILAASASASCTTFLCLCLLPIRASLRLSDRRDFWGPALVTAVLLNPAE